MGVEKMSVSFDLDLDLGEAIKSSAAHSGQSVSAWLADAARARLRLEVLGEAVVAWEATFGKLTEEELANAERILDRAGQKGRRGSA